MLCKQVARLLYFRIFFLSKNIVTTNVISMYYYADIIHIESSINLTSYPIRCKQFSFSIEFSPKNFLRYQCYRPVSTLSIESRMREGSSPEFHGSRS